tara:strand:- start:104 stop:517 length:414 start_codon:yes stop_codon:yes gene_type:complete
MAKIIFTKNLYEPGSTHGIAKDNVDISSKFPSHVYNIMDITDEQYDDLRKYKKSCYPQEDGSISWEDLVDRGYQTKEEFLASLNRDAAPNPLNNQYKSTWAEAQVKTYDDVTFPTDKSLEEIISEKVPNFVSEIEIL